MLAGLQPPTGFLRVYNNTALIGMLLRQWRYNPGENTQTQWVQSKAETAHPNKSIGSQSEWKFCNVTKQLYSTCSIKAVYVCTYSSLLQCMSVQRESLCFLSRHAVWAATQHHCRERGFVSPRAACICGCEHGLSHSSLIKRCCMRGDFPFSAPGHLTGGYRLSAAIYLVLSVLMVNVMAD